MRTYSVVAILAHFGTCNQACIAHELQRMFGMRSGMLMHATSAERLV